MIPLMVKLLWLVSGILLGSVGTAMLLIFLDDRKAKEPGTNRPGSQDSPQQP